MGENINSSFLFQLVVDFNAVGFGPVVFSNSFIFYMHMLLKWGEIFFPRHILSNQIF
jgi:hypothetical protein